MRIRTLIAVLAVLTATALATSAVANNGLTPKPGHDQAKVVFDMRDPVPEIAALHMQLILQTHGQLELAGRNPDIKIVFIAHPVKFLSSDRSAFNAEDQRHLEELDRTITRMIDSGIEIEVCRTAVDYFKVDPGSIRPDIHEVGNGWLSLVGYQEDGFKLIPVY